MVDASQQVNPSAADPDDYQSGVVAGYDNAPPTQAPDQPALITTPGGASSPAPAASLPSGIPGTGEPADPQAFLAALQKLNASQMQARQEHAQTWEEKINQGQGGDVGQFAPSTDQAPDYQTFKDGPDNHEDNKHSMMRDFADRMWAATLEGGADVLGVASFMENQLGSDPRFVQATEDAKEALQSHVAKTYDDLSDAGKEALNSSIWDGSAFKSFGRYISGTLADMAPTFLAAGGAGGLLARAAPRILGNVIPAMLGKQIATSVGSAAVFGMQNAGQTYNTMVDTVRDATPDQIKSSPIGAASLAQGRTLNEAKQDIIHATAAPFVALSAATGAVAGAGLGATATGAILPAGAPLLARVIASAGAGGLTMETQAAGSDVAEQGANIQAGVQKDFDPYRTAAAAAEGFATGAAMEGPLGALHTGEAPPVRPAVGTSAKTAAIPDPVTTNIDPATKVALDTTLTSSQPTPAITTEPLVVPGTPVPSPGQAPPEPPQGAPLSPLDEQDPVRAAALPYKQKLAEIKDPDHPRDTVFVPDNIRNIPVAQAGVRVNAKQNVGRLFTTDPEKLAAFKAMKPEDVTPEAIAKLEKPKGEQEPSETTVPKSPVEAAAEQTEKPTTPEKAEANDYAHGRVAIGGLPILIETPRGEERKGVGPDGREWSVKMPDHYGFIEGTKAADGHHLDVYLGPKADEAPNHDVYVIDQRDPKTGAFDEHKVMIGYSSPDEARDAYHKAFNDESGPARVGAITTMPFDEFKKWATNGEEKTKGVAYDPSKGDLIKYKAKVDREARKAEQARLKGEEFKKGEAYVDKPTEDTREELKTKAEPVIEAKPELTPSITEPREDIQEVLRDETGEPEHGEEDSERTPVTSDEIEIPEEAEPEAHEIEREREPVGPTATRQDLDLGDKTLADTSTDRKRDAEIAYAQVEQGLKTPREAAALFDHKPGTQGGRPPREEYRTFVNYLVHKLTADDEHKLNAEIDKLVALMSDKKTQIEQQLFKPTTKGKKGPIDRAIERIKEIQDRLDERKKIQGFLDELRDPVGAAVRDETKGGETGKTLDYVMRKIERDKAKQEAKAKAKENKGDEVKAKVSYATRVKQHLAANLNIQEAIKDAEAHGQVYSLPDLLRLAGKNLGASKDKRLTYLRNLINHLATIAPDFGVISPDAAYRKNLMPTWAKSKFDNNWVYGMYVTYMGSRAGEKPNIVLRVKPFEKKISDKYYGIPEYITLAHEAIHSIVDRVIDNSKYGSPVHAMITAINNEIVRLSEEDPSYGELTDYDRRQIRYATGFQGRELFTQVMTNPRVQEYLASVKPSDGFVQAMRKLGFDKAPRSIWGYIRDFLARVIGAAKPGTEFEGSVFDHMMAPMAHMVERGAEMVKAAGLLPDSREVGSREAGDMTSRASMLGAFGPEADKVADKISRFVDIGGVTDKARTAILQATTTDAIIKRYKGLSEDFGNALNKWRGATEAVAKTVHDYLVNNDAEAHELIKRLQGRDELAQLMNDATIAKATLGPNVDPKLNKKVANIGDLNARYNALSPQDRETYKMAKDFYKNQYELRTNAERKSLIDHFLPDATNIQKAAVDDLLRTRSTKEIQNFMDNADTSDIAKMFADKWDRNKNFVLGIADLVKGAKLGGDYFPLRRYGNYVVTYGDHMTAKDPDPLTRYGVEMFEKKSDAQARKAELESLGHANVSEVEDKRESMQRIARGDMPFVRKMFASLEDSSLRASQIQEARDLLASVVLEHGTYSDASRIARRKGIQGASREAARTLANEHLNLAYRLGYLEHGAERQNALEDVSLAARGMIGANNQIRASAVQRELELRTAANNAGSSFMSELARKATNLGFMQSVASPSHMLTSSMESQSLAASLLAPRHGAGAATMALGKALGDLGPRLLKEGARASFKAARKGLTAADWDMAKYGLEQLVKNGADRGQMERLFKPIQDAGLIDHTMDKDIRDIAAGRSYEKGKLGTAWSRFRDLNTIGAHAVDVMNRMAIAKAAFDLELSKTGSEAVAIERAVDVLRDAVPNYGAKARIATEKGVLGKFALPIMQFKNYGLHMYSVMGNLVHTSLRSADATERRQAAMALAGIFVTHSLMAGALTTVGDPLKLAGLAYDLFTGASKPHDFEVDARNFLSDIMGPTMGEIVSRGLPHAVGIDVHSRVGMSNLLEMPSLDSYDAKGFAKWLGAVFTGASGEDASGMIGGLVKLRQGDIYHGVEAMVPRVFRDPLKAIDRATVGVPGPHGTPGLPPIGLGGAVAQGLGFRPAQVSEYQEARSAVAQAKQEMQDAHSRLIQAWVGASDASERAEAMSAIQQYNADHPGQEVLPKNLFSALRVSRVQTNAQPNALGLSPRQAKAMGQAARFANI